MDFKVYIFGILPFAEIWLDLGQNFDNTEKKKKDHKCSHLNISFLKHEFGKIWITINVRFSSLASVYYSHSMVSYEEFRVSDVMAE